VDVGVNFRATSTFVADGANETYCLGDAYPVTRGGATFGWETGPSGGTRDRATFVDRRLAGINFSPATGDVFRVDLPAAGQYKVWMAMGDENAPQPTEFEILDGSTNLLTFTGNTGGPAVFRDATGALLPDTVWPTAEAPVTLTFATTILRLRVTNGAAGNNAVAHLRVATAPQQVSRGKRQDPIGLGSMSQWWRFRTTPPLHKSDNPLYLAFANLVYESPVVSGLGTVTADASATLGALTGSGNVTHPVVADASGALGSLTESAASGVAVAAAASGTLGGLTGSAAAQAVVGASESQSLGGLTGSAAATHPVVANASPTLGGLTETSAGTHPVTADQSKTLGTLQHTGAVAILAQFDANQNLAALTGSAAGVVAVAGSSSQTPGPAAGQAAGVVSVQAAAAAALGPLSSGGGTPASVLVQANAAGTLGTLTGSADATVLGAGFVSDATLGSLQGAAQAGVAVSVAADNALTAVAGVAEAVAPVAAAQNALLDPLAGFSDVSHGGAGPVADSSQALDPLTGTGDASVLTHAASAVTLGACQSSSVVPSTVYAAVRLSRPVTTVKLEKRTPAVALRRPVVTITV
jgi:hypothetical protein